MKKTVATQRLCAVCVHHKPVSEFGSMPGTCLKCAAEYHRLRRATIRAQRANSYLEQAVKAYEFIEQFERLVQKETQKKESENGRRTDPEILNPESRQQQEPARRNEPAASGADDPGPRHGGEPAVPAGRSTTGWTRLPKRVSEVKPPPEVAGWETYEVQR
jgi:hypothetical protein